MAKAKKQNKSDSTAAPEAKAAPAAGGKSKAAAKPVAPAAPVFDTTHAVTAAAALVSSGHTTAPVSDAPRKETAGFKQLKESMNKPHSQTIGGVLDKTAGPAGKKSSQPFSPFGKQVGRNQTFGADVNRTGVPRRTGG